jgi:hypothetical protein
VRGHAARRRGRGEAEHGVGRAARLESADRLEVLALEEERSAGLGVERLAGEHGRALDMRGNADMRRANRGKGEGVVEDGGG